MQFVPQSPSFPVSVIIFAEFRSIESTLAAKLPFSVATVILLYPAPGGPLTGFGVAGLGEAVLIGVALGDADGTLVGSIVGKAVGVAVISGVGDALGNGEAKTVALGIGGAGDVFGLFFARKIMTPITAKIRIITRICTKPLL